MSEGASAPAGAPVLAGLAVLASSAIVFLVQLVLSQSSGPPLEWSDLAGGGLTAGLSALVLIISLRAWLRVVQGGASAAPATARLVPVLLAVGLAGGGWFAWVVQSSRRAHLADVAVELCERPGFWRLGREACELKARACLDAAFRADEPPAAELEPLRGRVRTELERGRAEDDVAARTGGDTGAAAFAEKLWSRLNEPFSLGRKNRATLVCLGALDAGER